MNPQDDEDWLAALGGRPRPGVDPATLREATLLRRAQQRASQEDPVPKLQEGADALLVRARREGLLAGKAWCAGCAARWRAWRHWLARPGPAAGVALASLAMVLVALPLLRPAVDEEPTLRAGDDGLLLLSDPSPAARRDALADTLRAAGADVRRYERLGRFGLEAQWPTPPSAELTQALRAQRIAAPSGGLLRVEVQPAVPR